MHSQPEESRWLAGWRGIALVAATYIYFLIFAQFAFLKRLAGRVSLILSRGNLVARGLALKAFFQTMPSQC